MKLRIAFLACASLFVGAAAAADSFQPVPIDQAAKLFGARPSGFAPDLSPDGDKIVYLAAGPGASTAVHIEDLSTKEDKGLVKSSGKPEQLEWCGFADEQWIICRFDGWVKQGGLTFAAGRTVAIDSITAKIHPLGAPEHSDDDNFSQFDGDIVDWLPDDTGAVLMQRRYAGQNGYPDRIGVDRIQVNPFKVAMVEAPLARDFTYMTDGHGTVRLRTEAKSDLNGFFTGDSSYEFRLPSSDKWLSLTESGDDFTPLVIEKSSNSLYFLKPLNGRDALYRMTLDGSGS